MVKLDNWSTTIHPNLDNPYIPPECIEISLQGNVYGHPRFGPGHKVVTSPIVSIEGRVIGTKNTTYLLGKIDPEYRKYLKKERPDWDCDIVV